MSNSASREFDIFGISDRLERSVIAYGLTNVKSDARVKEDACDGGLVEIQVLLQ